jgi:hypothetical protein
MHGYSESTTHQEDFLKLPQILPILDKKLSKLPSLSHIFPSFFEESTETKAKYNRIWTREQVKSAYDAVISYSEKKQKPISELNLNDFGIISIKLTQTPEQVMIKFKEITANGTLKPGKWSQAEDNMLHDMITLHGQKWGGIAKLLNAEMHNRIPVRNAKTCKERWNNYLNPFLNREPWTEAEDLVLLKGFLKHGKQWALIAKKIEGRTGGIVKNRVNSLIKKFKKELQEGEMLEHRIKMWVENKIVTRS